MTDEWMEAVLAQAEPLVVTPAVRIGKRHGWLSTLAGQATFKREHPPGLPWAGQTILRLLVPEVENGFSATEGRRGRTLP